MTANCGPKKQLALVVLDAPRRYEVAGHGERERERERLDCEAQALTW